MNFLYDVPAALLLFVALALAIAVTALGQAGVHRAFKTQDFIAHNEVGGIIVAVAGTLYAVILGFLTVVAWQHFQDARQLVVLEADADIDAWHTAVGLPQSVRARVRIDMSRYAEIMVRNEWPLMRQGRFDADAAMISMDAIDAVGTLIPANQAQSNAQVATMQQLTVMHDARQQRIALNDAGVSGFEWLVLLTGATCIISFCWLFGLRKPGMQLLMTSAVVTITVSILVLLFELQYPFRSDVGIGPAAWQGAVAHIGDMRKGEMASMKM